jgi:Flp pilus assembly protein TadG
MTARREQGSATTELVLLTPVLIIVLLFVVALGRVASAHQEVAAAARDAARAATEARSAYSAKADGNAAAKNSLTEGGVTCRGLIVNVDTTDFHAGGLVTATVHCTLTLRDLAGLRIPTSRTMSSSFTAPIDEFRGVS